MDSANWTHYCEMIESELRKLLKKSQDVKNPEARMGNGKEVDDEKKLPRQKLIIWSVLHSAVSTRSRVRGSGTETNRNDQTKRSVSVATLRLMVSQPALGDF